MAQLFTIARTHSRYSYITLYVSWTITWAPLALGSGFEQKVAGSGRSSLQKVDLLWKFCQYFQYITVLLATKFVIPAADILLVLFQPCLLFHIHLFSLHSCTPYPSSSTTYKSSQGNSTSITLLMFSLYAHFVLLAPASLICLTVKKWRCGLSQTQLCSIYTVQLQWLALHSELQAF